MKNYNGHMGDSRYSDKSVVSMPGAVNLPRNIIVDHKISLKRKGKLGYI